eukprot:351271-Chlamydomonas_euryale.AAC.2
MVGKVRPARARCRLAAQTGSTDWQYSLAAQTGSTDWQHRLAVQTGSTDWQHRLALAAQTGTGSTDWHWQYNLTSGTDQRYRPARVCVAGALVVAWTGVCRAANVGLELL